MSFEPETPGQGEIELEHRSSFDISDADRSDSSQSSPAALNHSSPGEDSEALSTPSASPNSFSSSRPNTHHAAPSTRRSWMASERRLAASLDQLNAKDLAVHLYNTFKLSQRARNLKSRNEANDGIDEHVWNPPRMWTAWPLAPAIVPAEDEGLQWENESYLNGPTSSKKFTPREALEDILIGRLQKVAKERFLQGRSHNEISETPNMNLDRNEEHTLLEPVVMADDDLARNLSEPIFHHVFAKLDGLLTALHHARYAYAATEGFESSSHDETPNRKVTQQKRKSKQKSSQNETRSGKIKPRISNNSSASQVDGELGSSEQSNPSIPSDLERSNAKNQRATRPIRHKRRYGLRDWSDVIGVAAMTSWEPKTVQRAAIRGATLFDEGMKFRTLEENGTIGEEISILPTTRIEETESNHLGSGISSKQQSQDQDQDRDESVRNPKPRRSGRDKQGSRYYCPVPDCNRSSEGFSEAARLSRHLKMTHKQLKTQIAALYENAVGDDDEEMVGGVHVDGFLQPVPMPGSWVSKSRYKAKKESGSGIRRRKGQGR